MHVHIMCITYILYYQYSVPLFHYSYFTILYYSHARVHFPVLRVEKLNLPAVIHPKKRWMGFLAAVQTL